MLELKSGEMVNLQLRVYLTENDVQKLSEGRTFRYEDTIFKPSFKIMDICKQILDNRSLLNFYNAVLECGVQTTSLYLETPRKRRKKRKIA